ncbi:MAG: hypothetical protein L3J43_08075 [Sulfurovum sp.]|nr:hypothetical protein [Sulfurovum sp.]
MEKVTIKMYAVKHKLSVFNVIKMVKSKKLKTLVEEEQGKEVTYILIDDETEQEIRKTIVSSTERKNISVENEMKSLREDVESLKLEIEKLKKEIKCQKHSIV